MSKKKAVIVHINPSYKFPPVINLYEYVRSHFRESIELFIFTTGENTHTGNNGGENIASYAFRSDATGFLKLLNYIWLNATILIQLFRIRPHVLMYYETISVVPVYLYCLIFRPKLFIHYHELMTDKEYAATGFQSYLRKFERRLYQRAEWISHTNQLRLDYFIKENALPPSLKFRILENFPSSHWANISPKPQPEAMPTRFLYIGALDLKSMYIKEFFSWMMTKPDLSLTIYSQQNSIDIKEYCVSMGIKNVSFKGFIPYNDIPAITSDFQIGLIWYKPENLNFTYNAPNKLFEYYSCGLEVWFPKELEGAYAYMKNETDPRIIPVDFSDKTEMDKNYISFLSPRPFSHLPRYNYESVYEKLIGQWLN
ncbi:hypothetical protein [Flavihumibacter sp. ZG627]|uniref:hypothetical protein n=1 Tax=Flavihumibacter sp. ZG627 TaxID=1463156 RepID=UPI00057F0EB8|nr:hypothetical protein [Flavihumibacter sp. ZG627]KIC92269.1 hypothetical protein HY58_01590 [Flavihumibacter sp. ZG627]